MLTMDYQNLTKSDVIPVIVIQIQECNWNNVFLNINAKMQQQKIIHLGSFTLFYDNIFSEL